MGKTKYSIDWIIHLQYWVLPPPFNSVADGLHYCT